MKTFQYTKWVRISVLLVLWLFSHYHVFEKNFQMPENVIDHALEFEDMIFVFASLVAVSFLLSDGDGFSWQLD